MKNIIKSLILLLFISFNTYAKESTMNSLKTDTFKTKNNKEISISFIKHGSLILSYDGKLIYVDPISEYADFKKFPKADVILITHEHADHLDKIAIKDLTKKNTEIILNPNSQKILLKGKAISNGDKSTILDTITIEAVPAYNTTLDNLKYHPKGRDNGYVLLIDGIKIYIAGDTEDIKEMQKLKNIDIAFLPVNQPYTMTPEQAAKATKTIKPKVLYPYHYGDTKIEKLTDLLKNQKNTEVRIRNME